MTDTKLILIIIGIMIATAIIIFLIIPVAKGFNETGYVCDYLSNGTSTFYYCELRL